jgi:hypothetical protein
MQDESKECIWIMDYLYVTEMRCCFMLLPYVTPICLYILSTTEMPGTPKWSFWNQRNGDMLQRRRETRIPMQCGITWMEEMHTINVTPNVVVQWLTLLLRIWFKSRPREGYPDWGVSWFYSVNSSTYRNSSLKSGHNRLPKNPFQFDIYLSPFNLTLYGLSYLKSVVKWTTNYK